MSPRLLHRLVISLTIAGLAAGCGGDPSSPTPPPPPPHTPASLAIQAGNGQSAAAGSAVPINPAVVAKDAQGATVAGVLIDFTITQGGGTIGLAGVLTDQNGIASPGQWTLGPTPGPQALQAKLHEGSVPAVTITAMALAAEQVLVTQTVTASGGTILVNRPGSALDGVSLQFEAGALPTTASITLLESSVAGVHLPAGIQAVGPGLGISSTAGRLGAGALVRFPAAPIDGKLLMVALANPNSGAVTLLPLVDQDDQGVTALLPSLNSTALPRLMGMGSRDTELSALTLLVAINEELLAVDYDTGFRPGTDDWDFRATVVADLPFLEPTYFGAIRAGAVEDGWVSTALWYYVNRRKAGGGPPLNGSLQIAKGESQSSRLGIRWAALAEKDIPLVNQVGSLLIKEWGEWATDDRARFSWLQFRAIKALMLATLRNPVPVVLLDIDNPDEFNNETHPFAIAYRTVGNTLYLVSPLNPGNPILVQFTAEGGMAPFVIPTPSGANRTVRAIGGVHYVNVVDDVKLAAQWARVADETIGEAEGWPTPTLHWEKGELDTAKVYLLDELQHWWQCAGCNEKVPSPGSLPATASHVQHFRYGSYDGDNFAGLGGSYNSARFGAEAFDEGERSKKIGFRIVQPLVTDVELGTAVGWLDWIDVTYRKLTLVPSIDSITISNDTTISVTVAPSETPPGGTRYRWLLRTSDSQDSTETTVPSHTRDLDAGTDGWLVVSALEGEHKRPIARDSIRIAPDGGGPFWRIQTFADQDGFQDDIDGSGELFDLINRLLASPSSGVITYETVGSTDELKIRVRRSAVWSSTDCCPLPVFSGGTEWLLPLGFAPPTNNPVGPYFAGWGTSYWNQTSTSLTAGTVTGQWVPSTTSYTIEDIGVQTGPAGGFRFSATKTDSGMNGTLLLYLWSVTEASGELENPPDVYQFPFTAVRMTPSHE